jgi:hypothetical protein
MQHTMKSSLPCLIPFLPFLVNHLQNSTHFPTTLSNELLLPLYKPSARTTQKIQPVYCWEGLFTDLLHSNGRLLWLRSSGFRASCHNIYIYIFVQHTQWREEGCPVWPNKDSGQDTVTKRVFYSPSSATKNVRQTFCDTSHTNCIHEHQSGIFTSTPKIEETCTSDSSAKFPPSTWYIGPRVESSSSVKHQEKREINNYFGWSHIHGIILFASLLATDPLHLW